MTLLCFMLVMLTDIPIIMFLVAMLCDAAIIITLALTGVIHG